MAPGVPKPLFAAALALVRRAGAETQLVQTSVFRPVDSAFVPRPPPESISPMLQGGGSSSRESMLDEASDVIALLELRSGRLGDGRGEQQRRGEASVGASCLKRGAGLDRPANPLVFIHVPRNAGSSVEMCSELDPQLSASQRWGCANENIRGLTKMPLLSGFPGYASPFPPACYKQHVPPQYLPDVYHNKETFCIVSDPYSRMVSQFRFLMIHYPKWNQQNCTADLMNQALLEDLAAAKNENPYIADCHYLPQMTFVHGIDPSTAAPVFKDEKTRSCKHILRMEHLSADFEDLMSRHGYPYELPNENRAGGTLGPKDCSHLSKQHLSPKVRALIEDVFAQDFKQFGYKHL